MAGESEAIVNRRGKWSQSGVPHLGWTCVEEYDAKETGGELITCDMCETMEVRFVHVMANQRYPEQLHCGCVCAAHMSGEKKQAEERDSRMRARARRRQNFATRKGWKVSKKGTPYIDIDGYHFVVAKKADGRFQVGAKAPTATEHRWGKKRYTTVREAKTGAFDALEALEAEREERESSKRALLLSAVLAV